MRYFRIYFISPLLFMPTGMVGAIPISSILSKNIFAGTVMLSFRPKVETYNGLAVV
jgi:hypothetical protein